jgi:putative inorganic carbon (HCO3(-)) transporter
MSFAAYLLYLILTYLRPIEMFAPELSDYRPMLWLWGFAFVSAASRAYGRWEIATRPLFLGLMSLLVVSIAASLVAGAWFGSALDALNEFSTAGMLFVLTCLNLMSIRRIRTTCMTLTLCMVVISIFTIAAYRNGFMADQLVLRQNTDMDDALMVSAPFEIPVDDTSGTSLWRVRFLGFLNDPNDLAQAIVMVLPMLWLARRPGHRLRTLIKLGLPGAVLLYALYLTHSRGGLLGLGAMVLFGMRNTLGIARTAILGIAILFAVNVLNLDGGRGFSTKEESASERIEAWDDGIQMLKSHPLLGVGYGNFLEHHVERTAHNSFVLCFAELGLLGFFAWIALLVVAFRETSQAILRTPADSPEHSLARALRSALVGFVACAWFLSRTYQPGLYLLLALCASTAYCVRRDHSQSDGTAEWQPLPWIGLTGTAMFASITAIYGLIVINHLLG